MVKLTKKRGDTRQEILEAALRLFRDRGYDGTGVADIVGAAGVTPPPLYYYFGSKDGLLRALVDPSVEALDRLVAHALEADPDATNRRRFLRDYLDVLLRWHSVVCFLADDPAVRNHREVGGRLQRQQERLQPFLADERSGAAGSVAAAAALGSIWRPVTTLSEDVLNQHKERIIAAAMAALRAASK